MLRRVARPISFATACIVLSACTAPPVSSGNGAVGASGASGSTQTFGSSSSTTVATSDASQNDVVVCRPPSECTDCKTIGSGLSMPQGIGTGSSGGEIAPLAPTRYYVADYGHQRVVVFTVSSDECETEEVLDDSGYFPSDVAVARDGTVAVTNRCAAPSCTAGGNISFFAPGSTHVTSVATGLISQFYYGAFDKRGNFYNDGFAGTTVEIGVVRHGSTTDKATGISGIGFPGGIQVAKNGTINVDDQDCPCIQIYKAKKHVGTVSLPGVERPVTFALNKSNTQLWVTDVTSNTVDELPYPAGGKILYQITGFSEPIGVGVAPPSKP
jgi:hypothetical protein